MFKSLYSGVSGLSANLTNLDVIGNNIANSNTVGFKSGRVTFNEMLTQTIRSASRPVSGGLGGTNPQQIGLGTRVGSIDTNFNQGNFETTGKKTDLAIQGSGFFMLSDGTSRTYTRAGVFGLDSSNYLVSPSTGLKVQGVMADEAGVLPVGPMQDIYIEPGLVVPASASTAVQLMGNLDASSDARSTIMESPSFLVAATGGDLLVDMSGQTAGGLDLDVGSFVTINGRAGGTDISTNNYEVTETSTLQDLVDWLNTEAAGSATFNLTPNGEIAATNVSGGDIDGLSLTVESKTNFNDNLAFASTIANGAVATTNELRAYADENDLLINVYDEDGTYLDIDFASSPTNLVLGGSVGGETLDGRVVTVDGATTMGDLAREWQYALGTYSTPIAMNEEGQIIVTGEVGTASNIGKITIAEEGRINAYLTGAFNFTQIQEATDQRTYSLSTRVYDSQGGEHTLTFNFEKVPGENEWLWEADAEGNDSVLTGATGRATFDPDGSIASFTFDGGASSVTIQPLAPGTEGAEIMNLEIDFGEIGGLTGLTQFSGEGNLTSIADGYGSGTLVDFTIGQSGVITGIFSNDTMMDIAQIGVAEFANPAGLVREANNTYRRSGNSGVAVETFAGLGNGVTLVPGALETSNVDLAKEFTNLVVAQRSFQANSRVVTTADQVMQELVNLIR
ncbi:MAG: flagellar hook-basal body complex protein [bacterium]|nr:flagellar hook-basal body complex protein [bacterium]